MRPQSLFWIRADNPLSTIVPTKISNLNNVLTLIVQPSGSLYSNIRHLELSTKIGPFLNARKI